MASKLEKWESESYPVELLEKFGDKAQYLLPAFMGVYALATGHLVQGVAYGILGALQGPEVEALKKYFPKKRPRSYYKNIEHKKDYESFPSAHTGGTFLAAGLSLGLFGATSPLTITTVALASLTGLSRILSQKHHLTDVLGGAAIGLLNGFVASRF